jgi:predicted RecB family nuclease
VELPATEMEIFFDVEVDPFRDICYLHGFIERVMNGSRQEKYVAFFVQDVTEASELQSIEAAYRYLKSMKSHALYYYSHYELTTWRKLQAKYPQVAPSEEIDELLSTIGQGSPSRVVDLFQLVRSNSVWPTNDHSIKTLAKYLGFSWRDLHPSGAASIQWFDEWVKTQDPASKQRILEYNEDDCRAMVVLLDSLRNLTIRGV